MQRLVIIGAGMATAYLLRELGRFSHDYHIAVYGAEPSACYNRILLSSALANPSQAEELSMLGPEQTDRQQVTFYNGEKVLRIDTDKKILFTESGHSSTWDILVFATGSSSTLPPIDGVELNRVHAFRSLTDLESIRLSARSAEKAVVIGGGLLGLEAAIGLVSLGLECTVIHRGGWIMNRQLDENGASLLQEKLETMGIRFLLGSTPEAITAESKTLSVSCSAHPPEKSDLVIIATGITPNTEPARSAGIPCSQGIIVDDCMQTTAASVYALGECCEWQEQTFGLVTPIKEQAKVLAHNLCHQQKLKWQYEPAPVHLKISGVDVVSGGQFPYPDSSTSQFLIDRLSGTYRRLVFSKDRLIGYQLVGDKTFSAWYCELLQSNQDVTDIRHRMMFTEINREQPLSRVA